MFSAVVRSKLQKYCLYICLDFIQGACTESLDARRPSPRSNYAPSPPMKLMTSQSLPPSSASNAMIMSHRIDLAGLGHRKNSLTLHCFLRKTLIKVTESPLPTPMVFTQNKEATRLGQDSQLTPSKMASPLVFFRLHWLEYRRCLCSSQNLAGTF